MLPSKLVLLVLGHTAGYGLEQLGDYNKAASSYTQALRYGDISSEA
jgi:hypothetical protein